MEWLYLIAVYVPVISMAIGITLLTIGCIVRKSKRKLSKVLLIAGGSCAGICLLAGIALFLIGALGIGPVPT